LNSLSALLAIAVASSGYILATHCFFFKFKVARQSGHRLYLTVLTLGFAALILTKILFVLLSIDNVTALSLSTFVLTFIASLAYNKYYPNSKQRALVMAWQKDDMEQLIAHCALNYKPLMVNLHSRKTYVGIVRHTREPDPESAHISILPILSGYRTEDELHLKLTHRYDKIISFINKAIKGEAFEEEIDPQDFVIVIPTDSINTMHIFNPDLYLEIDGDEDNVLGSAES
jgi:hypothetical protein